MSGDRTWQSVPTGAPGGFTAVMSKRFPAESNIRVAIHFPPATVVVWLEVTGWKTSALPPMPGPAIKHDSVSLVPLRIRMVLTRGVDGAKINRCGNACLL